MILSLLKILHGANAFGINDIQEHEAGVSRVSQLQCYIAFGARLKGRTEFSTGTITWVIGPLHSNPYHYDTRLSPLVVSMQPSLLG
jgi:hypothetical protein